MQNENASMQITADASYEISDGVREVLQLVQKIWLIIET